MSIMAPVTVYVNTSEIFRYVDENGLLEKELEQELLFAGFKVAQHGRERANEQVPIATGTLSDTIKVIPPVIASDSEGFTYTSGISSGDGLGIYPSVMEFGRSAGSTPPPIDPIVAWLSVKVAQGQFDISRYKGKRPLRSAAFAVSKSIGSKGIAPHKFMTAGSELMHSELEPRINAVMEAWANKSSLPSGGV